MIKPLSNDQYILATEMHLNGMVASPQVLDVVLVNTDHPVVHARVKLVGWTRDNRQVYLRSDGYLAFAKDPWVPVEATPAR